MMPKLSLVLSFSVRGRPGFSQSSVLLTQHQFLSERDAMQKLQIGFIS
jgi:hypothetical protein